MKEMLAKIHKFREERGWIPYHNAKNLAISISLEASELLEIFQWKSAEDALAEDLSHIKEELADVLIYAFTMADALELDIREIMEQKIALNAEKYPLPEK